MTIEFIEKSPTCIEAHQCGCRISTIYKWQENIEIDFDSDRDCDYINIATILDIRDMELILNKMKELSG